MGAVRFFGGLVPLILLQRVSSSYPNAFVPPNLAGLTKNYTGRIGNLSAYFGSKIQDPCKVKVDFDALEGYNVTEQDLNWSYFDQLVPKGYINHSNFAFAENPLRKEVTFVLNFDSKIYNDNYVAGEVDKALEVTVLTRNLGLYVQNLQPESNYEISSNCDSNLFNTGQKVCSMMSCRELSPSGNIRCYTEIDRMIKSKI